MTTPPQQGITDAALIDAVQRAICVYAANAPEDRQQLPAIQFIENRSDEIAEAALAAMRAAQPTVDVRAMVERLRSVARLRLENPDLALEWHAADMLERLTAQPGQTP